MKIIELGKGTNYHNGKAGNLNNLYNAFNIARGFILPNSFFLEFLEINNISLSDNLNTIKTEIMNGIFPEENKLLDYYKKNKYKKVIVRSSAYLEDSNNFSFAGQFESFTNTDISSLIVNIKKCLASQFEDNVKEYLKEKKISYNYVFDVLIQEMVISDISGVAFSINPTNGSDEILIEVSKGQCEELVRGNVLTNIYHIDNEIRGDDLVSKKQLLLVAENINKLKEIFKKEIEIEFCFKNDVFYLFQVRAITKIYFSLNSYIRKEFWCCFKNNNWTLFNRSLWILGATKYKNKRITNDVTEDITIYYPYNQKQIRGFNGNQLPLDEVTIKNHTSCDVDNYIIKSYSISDYIIKLSHTIDINIEDDNFHDFNINLKHLIKQNAILNSYEYLISSLGNALYEKLDQKTIKNIEKWRNDTSNSYFPIYNKIFKYIHDNFHLDISIELFKMYIHVNELISLCNKTIKPTTLINRINKREKEGFILLNLRNKKYGNKVINSKETINIVKERFSILQGKVGEDINLDGIKGKSTFKNGKIITGECIVIKDNCTNISNFNLNGKILVCEVTTAKDIQYLKNLKALIVNSGGILCHSAIFSREFSIPCLMGCKNATEYFNSGDLVSYDIDDEFVKKIN
ncbi:MAG: PEP-utilizing enzyme [Ruminococcus sp.]|nr:PEP-utilizing enzyme [Ruminococcus sp.]